MSLLPVEEALSRILSGAQPLGVEEVPLGDADGRVLARDLEARLTQPPFDASAMDGFAIRAVDTGPDATLRVIGESAAGHAFAYKLAAGEAVRIYTGAPLPRGADAIVIQEDAVEIGGEVHVSAAARQGQHIRPAGNDFREGDTLLFAGDDMGPRTLLLAAAMDHAIVPVRRKPVIAILSTGDELVAPGEPRRPDQIVGSLSFGIASMVRRAGAEPVVLARAGDSPESLDARLDEVGDADILLTIGGASVGKHDIVRQRLEVRGLKLDFWKIAMRPGKPLMFGRLGEMRVIGIPGNPVSAMICARLFLVPLIGALLGRARNDREITTAVLGTSLEKNGPRQHYIRAASKPLPDGRRRVTPLPSQDSSLMSALKLADCLLVRRPDAPAAEPGELIEILPVDF